MGTFMATLCNDVNHLMTLLNFNEMKCNILFNLLAIYPHFLLNQFFYISG